MRRIECRRCKVVGKDHSFDSQKQGCWAAFEAALSHKTIQFPTTQANGRVEAMTGVPLQHEADKGRLAWWCVHVQNVAPLKTKIRMNGSAGGIKGW